jgi:hypothetical protein
MSESAYEYKTVALPQTVQGKRRRGQTEADQVAMALGETIHAEAVDGWEYMRSDILAAQSKAGMFSKEPAINYYTVMVFRRALEAVWAPEDEDVRPIAPPAGGPTPAQPQPQPQGQVQGQGLAPPPRKPLPHPDTRRAAAERPAEPKPAPALVDDPTSPLANGGMLSTGGQFRSEASGWSRQPDTRPPLGSAQD